MRKRALLHYWRNYLTALIVYFLVLEFQFPHRVVVELIFPVAYFTVTPLVIIIYFLLHGKRDTQG